MALCSTKYLMHFIGRETVPRGEHGARAAGGLRPRNSAGQGAHGAIPAPRHPWVVLLLFSLSHPDTSSDAPDPALTPQVMQLVPPQQPRPTQGVPGSCRIKHHLGSRMLEPQLFPAHQGRFGVVVRSSGHCCFFPVATR